MDEASDLRLLISAHVEVSAVATFVVGVDLRLMIMLEHVVVVVVVLGRGYGGGRRRSGRSGRSRLVRRRFE